MKRKFPYHLVRWAIPILLLAVLATVARFPAQPEMESSTTRGAKPPLVGPTVISRSMDLYDEGISNLRKWDQNPWRFEHRGQFGERIDSLRDSNDPRDQAEYQELLRLGNDWFERILARYPDLAVTSRNVPDNQNGLLHLRNLMERLNGDDSGATPWFPKEFNERFRKNQIWNPQGVKSWLDANRSLLDEIRAIGLMPDRSSGRFPYDRYYNPSIIDLSEALLLEARFAAAQGEVARALESVRASKGLANHLKDGEAPTFHEAMSGFYIEKQTQKYVMSHILPSLPAAQVDISAWEDAVNPTLQQPADFSRVVRGEWHANMAGYLLPALSNSVDPNMPIDPEALAEAYTLQMYALVRHHENLALVDLPSEPADNDTYANLSWRSREIAKNLRFDPWNGWKRAQSETGLTQAAFAILKGQPISNDPIYGKPYIWDPVTRQLSVPDSPEFQRKGFRPLVVPEL